MDEKDSPDWAALLGQPAPVVGEYDHIEVSSDIRDVARTTRELYVGFRKEGFTEREALALVGTMLVAGGQS